MDSFQDNCRALLKRELQDRCQKNPQYSLRAFARSLGMESSYLSKILSGKRNITQTTLKKLAAKLSFNEDSVKAFQKLQGQKDGYQSISADQIIILSEWQHFAILEVLVNKPEANAKKLAYHLGINELLVKDSIERLSRVGYIQWNEEDEKYDILSPKNSTEGLPIQAALKNLQKQFLELAIEALRDVSEDLRDQSGMTMMVDTSRIPEARKLIKKFRRDMSKLLEGSKTKDQVFQLSVSLFPLSKNSWREN